MPPPDGGDGKRVNSARRKKRKQKRKSPPKILHVELLHTPSNMVDDEKRVPHGCADLPFRQVKQKNSQTTGLF